MGMGQNPNEHPFTHYFVHWGTRVLTHRRLLRDQHISHDLRNREEMAHLREQFKLQNARVQQSEKDVLLGSVLLGSQQLLRKI
jgi:hypothetical protein